MNAIKCTLLSMLVVAATLPSKASAQSVLDGLDKLYVDVTYMSESVAAAGIDEEDLIRDVSLELSRAGLVVLSAMSQKPDTPFVALALDAVKLPDDTATFHVALELREDVYPVRNSGISFSASSWYSSRFGPSDTARLGDDCLASVTGLVDEFLAEWAGATP